MAAKPAEHQQWRTRHLKQQEGFSSRPDDGQTIEPAVPVHQANSSAVSGHIGNEQMCVCHMPEQMYLACSKVSTARLCFVSVQKTCLSVLMTGILHALMTAAKRK